jgi:signal transduction histidine kinase
MRVEMRALGFRPGWWTGIALAAVIAVNLAGIGGIAVARRGAKDEAKRQFQDETAGWARSLERMLAGVRSDLAFLAASSPVGRLGEKGPAAEIAWRRAGAESALLLYLRSHPEVVRVVVRNEAGEPIVHTGRRGGIPVLWVSSSPTGLEGAAVAPDRPRLTTGLAIDAEGKPGSGQLAVEAEVEPSLLFPASEGSGTRACELRDGSGRVLTRTPGQRATAREAGNEVAARAEVGAEGWSAPQPWVVECERTQDSALALVEPVAARYRATLALNLGVMALAVLLGGFAVQQARRRERLEAAAHEEARVRDLERQLFHAERLTTVGRLAAGIAHEINNPLEGMANYLALAREALARRDLESAQRHVASVKAGLDRAAGIVRGVLAHADPAKSPLTPLDLVQVLRESGQFMASRKEFGGLQFAFDLGDTPLLVRGSPVKLGQVAVNLILNACEAQPRGGEVRVTARRENGAVVAEFADRGPGIGEAEGARIFEPFYSTKDSTGLGLSICHSIVKEHSGELSVGPREGGGAVFRLKLPALEATPA